MLLLKLLNCWNATYAARSRGDSDRLFAMLLADSRGPESAIEESSAIWAETTVGVLVCMLNGVHTPCIVVSVA
jgi:hypothetical protein